MSNLVSQNPFDLVVKDLEYTKELAINNILKTEYKELQDASQYNMMLKGKNFRSAILFTMARAIYKTNSNSKINFEETR